jgi:hypothetical protein
MLANLRSQINYNARILLANSYWILIIPLVASQLVVFWHMAIATLVKTDTIVKTAELVIPLMAAFLCAHVVAPEHRHRVDEIAFVRRKPVALTIILRLLTLYLIVALLALVMLYVYRKGLKREFDLGWTLLAAVPPTLFLSMLSMAFASAWRTPAAGIGAALVYFAADAARGQSLNPLFTLHSYSAALALVDGETAQAGSQWLYSKAVLLAMAVVAAWAGARTLGRPASPRRLRAGLRVAAGVVGFALFYLVSGAVWQFTQASKVEAQTPDNAWFAYQRAFTGYGHIPVAYLFGADFAGYVGYPAGDPGDPKWFINMRGVAAKRLTDVAARWPESKWADNALFEALRLTGGAEKNRSEDPELERAAIRDCQAFLKAYPTSSFAAGVATRLVRAAHRQGDVPTMMEAFDKVTKIYRAPVASSEASAELQQYYLARGETDRAIAMARQAVQNAPPETRADAMLELASYLQRLGRKQEAREMYANVEKAVNDKLDAMGLRVMTPDTANAENMARRAEVLKLRNKAREGLAAVSGSSP